MTTDLNSRAARLAGWTFKDYDGAQWWRREMPDGVEAVDSCPDYSSSLDLIRRDLLPLVSADAWFHVIDRILLLLATNDPRILDSAWFRYVEAKALITAPTEVILRAVLEVLESGGKAS